jgi:glycosyltransferase involved in cell wall biosynthesis
LILAGNGRISELRELVRTAGLESTVVVRDWLDPAQRDEALAQADVYVLPSLNEGLPMGMLEAMSWGLAVITSAVGGIPEVISNESNGVLVPPGDVSSIAEAMQRMITDRELRSRLSIAARESVRSFDVERYWSSLYPILDSAKRTA